MYSAIILRLKSMACLQLQGIPEWSSAGTLTRVISRIRLPSSRWSLQSASAMRVSLFYLSPRLQRTSTAYICTINTLMSSHPSLPVLTACLSVTALISLHVRLPLSACWLVYLSLVLRSVGLCLTVYFSSPLRMTVCLSLP